MLSPIEYRSHQKVRDPVSNDTGRPFIPAKSVRSGKSFHVAVGNDKSRQWEKRRDFPIGGASGKASGGQGMFHVANINWFRYEF